MQDLDNKFLKNNEEDEARPEVSRVDSAQLVPGVIQRDTADLSTDAAAAAARKVRCHRFGVPRRSGGEAEGG